MFYGWWLVLVGVITQGLGTGGVVYAYSVLVLPLEREFQATRMAMMLGSAFSGDGIANGPRIWQGTTHA
jgi:hypothetical protein